MQGGERWAILQVAHHRADQSLRAGIRWHLQNVLKMMPEMVLFTTSKFLAGCLARNSTSRIRPKPRAGSGSPIAADSPKIKIRQVSGGLLAAIRAGCGERARPGEK